MIKYRRIENNKAVVTSDFSPIEMCLSIKFIAPYLLTQFVEDSYNDFIEYLADLDKPNYKSYKTKPLVF